MSDFWDRVHACEHANKTGHCGVLPQCECNRAIETRCADCKVYITDDPCGEIQGMDGWPWSKRRKRLRSYR